MQRKIAAAIEEDMVSIGRKIKEVDLIGHFDLFFLVQNSKVSPQRKFMLYDDVVVFYDHLLSFLCNTLMKSTGEDTEHHFCLY